MTTEEKLKITMSERRPMSIVKADWPVIAKGSAFSGQYEFQAADGARVRVRRHADGRMIVYGYAGDWDGGGRPTRENREAGFLIPADADSAEVVRAIRRVAGILAETDIAGQYADEAARNCIADLPAEEDVPDEPIAVAAIGTDKLALLLALLVQAKPHCPPELQEEIRAALSGK
jgi:hypothetical protein